MTTFVETTKFTKQQPRFLPGDAYAQLQRELTANPQIGKVMPGCGGLRKLRIADPRRQKDKRGGARVIYLYIAEIRQFLMVGIYGKGEQEDLIPDEKKLFREIAREYKASAVRKVREEGMS